jgi:small subunit ribosomal protein S13
VRTKNTNKDKVNMVRIAGVMLPDKMKVDYSLTTIFGVGWNNVKDILKLAQVDSKKRTMDLTEDEFKRIQKVIEKSYSVEGNLREEISGNIRRLKEIASYRGIRHVRGLPVNGQRTKSNARTKRGKRKTVGALKKEDAAKLTQAAIEKK